MKLPPEILGKIFTESNISKNDLLQLQITCKHWSPIAEKALYTSINLEGADSDNISCFAALKRAKLLIRSLVLPNNHSRIWIQTINFGQIFDSPQSEYTSQDPHFNIALLAHLCPNIRNVFANAVTKDFYKLLTQLHCDGYLQHLQNICWPELTDSLDHNLWISYHTMLKEFKYSIKEILLLDPSSNGLPNSIALAKKHLITTDTLRNFAKLESIHVLEFARMKLHQLEKYIRQYASQLRHVKIDMKDETGIRHEGSVNMITAQPQQQVIQLEIMFNEPITKDDMLYMMQHFPSLQELCFAVNGPLDDLSDSIDIATIYQFLEYLFTIPYVDFDEIHLSIDNIPQLIHFVTRSIQVKTVRFSALDPKGEDQGLISLQCRTKNPKAINKSEQTKTDSCQFEITLISHEPQMLLSHVLNVIKTGDVEKLIIGPQYIQESTLSLQITQDMIDVILNNYQVLKSLIFTLVEFPENTPAVSAPGQKKHLETLALQECVINSSYLVELSRRIEHVDELRYLDSNVDQYYLDSENAKISVHMPHTTFSSVRFMFPAIRPYLIQITTPNACIRIKTSRKQGMIPISSEEYTQIEIENDTYQVDMICNAVNTITTNYGSFKV
ncbi:hypothetical protein MAM1_0068d04075 [Mucor ambiguus]|uniref:F-box domain-containing protein n=1 Tax=Mucor ambiguus TaxID=91626 RepID=A0A0C9MBA2_9FUNG|nr:hypothetical protein MAM1_0068d04075 [Mucor ambiguus]